jgi:hypothetical protein
MITILTDSTYGIILSIFEMEASPSFAGVEMKISQESFIDGKETNMFSFKDEEIPEEIKSSIKTNPTEFIYSEEFGFKLRPKIILKILDKSLIKKVSRDGAQVVPIKTPIKMRAEYYDPDNVGFLEILNGVKMKDRNDFITTPTEFDLEDGKYDFEVKSDFPGISTIRAKDKKYICGFDALGLRFKS